MNVKKKFEDVKSKIRENRSQIVAAVSTGIAVVLTVALADSTKKLRDAATLVDRSNEQQKLSNNLLNEYNEHLKADRNILLAMGEDCMETLKNSGSLIWESNGHRIDLAYDPDCCEPVPTKEV